MSALSHLSNLVTLIFCAFFLALAACSKKERPVPPVAKIVPKDVSVHGDKRIDNYFWLRERDNPEVLDYLRAENAYTEKVMAHTEELQQKLYDEMVARIKETDLEVPERVGEYYYYNRTEEGKQYPIHCRKKGSLDAPEEVLLDENELAKGHDYFRIGVLRVSPDQRLLAFSTDTTGGERYTIHVKDLRSGEILPDEIPNTYYSMEWANDNRTLFYNTLDAAMRPFKLYKHVLGAAPDRDELVHFEEDESYFLELSKSKSRAYLFLRLESSTTTEVWYLDANKPERRFKLIHPRQHGMEYYVEHHGDKFYILTNDHATNFKLMEAPVSRPAKRNWKETFPYDEAVKLDRVEPFKDHLVIYERENGLPKIRILDMKTGETHFVSFDEPAYSIRRTANPEFDTTTLRFKYSSLVTPESVYDYDMNRRTRELKKQTEVLGGYDPAQYQTERIFAQAPDGVKVPISLVYKKGLRKNGKNPLFLYGYGSYGITVDPGFSSNRLSLLDRGFVYAIAHIRGGGAMGRTWYEDGKLLHKKNTFTDFIACAEHLIHEGYTSPERLVIYGGSAGGLLIGAVVNMRPELFKAAVAKVPFVDVVNTMLDASIPLTVIEYEEWGDPNDKTYYEYIKSYSPYDNVRPQAYPNMLITAGLNDPRVQYWEPAKWTAKLRATKTDDNLLLLKVNMGAGHGGASGRYRSLHELAFEYAFIFDVLGING
ncbi:MAG: S9 family peptidase [Calditrichaeota bacterium]|nr:MAG: S9 family peptidase [Calditrichota bacterium]